MGEYKIKQYTSNDIDLFIGVDIETEDLYILPVEFSSRYSSSISVNSCNEFKNNFKQLEPIIGNNNSEVDDNVETLTDNADGNDVGIGKPSRERADNPPPKSKDRVKTCSRLQT